MALKVTEFKALKDRANELYQQMETELNTLIANDFSTPTHEQNRKKHIEDNLPATTNALEEINSDLLRATPEQIETFYTEFQSTQEKLATLHNTSPIPKGNPTNKDIENNPQLTKWFQFNTALNLNKKYNIEIMQAVTYFTPGFTNEEKTNIQQLMAKYFTHRANEQEKNILHTLQTLHKNSDGCKQTFIDIAKRVATGKKTDTDKKTLESLDAILKNKPKEHHRDICMNIATLHNSLVDAAAYGQATPVMSEEEEKCLNNWEVKLGEIKIDAVDKNGKIISVYQGCFKVDQQHIDQLDKNRLNTFLLIPSEKLPQSIADARDAAVEYLKAIKESKTPHAAGKEATKKLLTKLLTLSTSSNTSEDLIKNVEKALINWKGNVISRNVTWLKTTLKKCLSKDNKNTHLSHRYDHGNRALKKISWRSKENKNKAGELKGKEPPRTASGTKRYNPSRSIPYLYLWLFMLAALCIVFWLHPITWSFLLTLFGIAI